MTREDKKEIIIKGSLLGAILFVSTFIYLVIYGSIQSLVNIGTFFVPILLGYSLIGIIIRWLVYRSALKKESSHLFSGVASYYWVWMLCIVFSVCAYFIPQAIRYIILTNAAVLLLVWVLDYLYLKNIAKELNSGLKYHRVTLVEDLLSRPKTENMFMEEIEIYCNKNHLTLEVIEYGMPAKIKMDNTPYLVKLGQYYSMVGTVVYTLEFRSILSNAVNSNS
ncbi:DUF4318 domain-containing protein [Clostridium sp. YIM B02515]|uniref:DUF4318 domain-containing protein n=1 Tax=Clostridium rhizosphaerae TaxID=2803861 RepID=A0ABS1T4T2_9CLOT|nr:DUF4318 domain-containing protein [Clostridium rhizosphaerae]MBL4934330.1 DUF4318 domain-containing protein [Clostridium rhizosphaerae]